MWGYYLAPATPGLPRGSTHSLLTSSAQAAGEIKGEGVIYTELVVSVSYRVHTHVRSTHTRVHVVAVHDFTSYTLNDSVQFVWSGGQGPTHTPTLSHTTYAINTHVLNLCG